MKKILAVLVIPAVIAACQSQSTPTTVSAAPSASLVQSPSQATDQVVPGRIIVKLQAGVAAADVAAANGLSVEGRGLHDAFVLMHGAAGNERAVAARVSHTRGVVYAEPDYLRHTSTIDPRLWAFYNPGGLTIDYTRGRSNGQPVTSYLSVNDADEDNVADYASGGSDVTIGSIDTGVEFDHPEFTGETLIAGHDWYSNDNDPSDEDGHGTHTAGTMIGRNVGVAGVSGAWQHVGLLVQRVCGSSGCPSSAIASAIMAAADYGVVAMNLSLGGSAESQAEHDAITYATNAGSLVIAAAGNDGTSTISCPACDPNAISVGATNWQDGLTYYTNWGSGLDIVAPGGEMYSNTTDESGIYSSYLGGGYAYLQGTSMATPQVTGTAGIVASVTGLRGAALRSRILGSTDDLGAPGYDTQFGNGRLNSYRAVTDATLDESGGGGGGSTLAASFSYSCGGNSTCNFDGSSSTGATSWSWTFGDGGTGNGATVSHTFGSPGNYSVTLTVGDGSSTDSQSQTISCSVKGKRLHCN
jgi:subtilisin family serine protease